MQPAASALPRMRKPNRLAFPLTLTDLVPVALIVVLITAATIWNFYVGLVFAVPFFTLITIPVGLALFGIAYGAVRPGEWRLTEFILFPALWFIFPLFGDELTYLALSLGFPMRDHFFEQMDTMLGFSWIGWQHFVMRHYWFYAIQAVAYLSSFWQPFLTAALLAFIGPRGRNAEFLTAILIGLIFTIAIFAVMPAEGPERMHGISARLNDVIDAIRQGKRAPLLTTGIVCFPSFHTGMAIVFTWAHRGMRWTFWPVALLNTVMLVAIPFWGDHYLFDMIGGAIVALAAICITSGIGHRIHLVSLREAAGSFPAQRATTV